MLLGVDYFVKWKKKTDLNQSLDCTSNICVFVCVWFYRIAKETILTNPSGIRHWQNVAALKEIISKRCEDVIGNTLGGHSSKGWVRKSTHFLA